MNEFHRNYRFGEPVPLKRLAGEFVRIFSKETTMDVRAYENTFQEYVVGHLPISSKQPNLTGHVINIAGIEPNLTSLRRRVAGLVESQDLPKEIRAIRQKCGRRQVYVVVVSTM